MNFFIFIINIIRIRGTCWDHRFVYSFTWKQLMDLLRRYAIINGCGTIVHKAHAAYHNYNEYYICYFLLSILKYSSLNTFNFIIYLNIKINNLLI